MERERKLKRAQTKASERAGKKTRGDWGRRWNRLGSVGSAGSAVPRAAVSRISLTGNGSMWPNVS